MRYAATVKWNGGNSRITVAVEAANEREAREKARVQAQFQMPRGQTIPEYATVTIKR